MSFKISNRTRTSSIQVTEDLEKKANELIKEFDGLTFEKAILLTKRLQTILYENSLVRIKTQSDK
jgi:hypothetical protein